MTVRWLLAGLCWLPGSALAMQQQPQAPFERILYMHGGPQQDTDLAKAISHLGFTGVSLRGGLDPTWPAEEGLSFYLDQVVGKGILEMRDPQWQQVRKAYLDGRMPRTLLRPRVLADPETKTELLSTLQQNLERVATHRPRYVCLGDEVSITRHGNPLDLCFADSTLIGFRDHLRRQFKDVAAMNQAFGTRFTGFDVVLPMTADQIRSREFQTSGFPSNLRPWAEHRVYMDQQFATLLRTLRDRIQSLHPGLPSGLTGIQTPSAYGGHDLSRLMPWMTFFEAYDIGGARDLAMCLAPPGAAQVTTIFNPPAGASINRVRMQVADAIAHGMAGLIVWSAGDVLDADKKPTSYGLALKDAFEILEPAAKVFAGARLERSSVYLVESQASVRAWWMLDSRQDGSTWINRLTSHEATHSTSQAARRSWLRLLEDLGLQGRCVPEADLPALLAKTPPRLLILPATIALSDAACQAIVRFVETGGVVVADHSPAFYDEHLVLRVTPGLDSLFGLQGRSEKAADLLVREGKANHAGRLAEGPAAAELSVRGPVAEVLSDHHVQMERLVGQGRAVYLNLAVCEYATARVDARQHRTAFALRNRVRRVLELADVLPVVAVRGEGLPTMIERIQLEGRNGERLLVVRLNVMDAPDLAAQIRNPDQVRITLTFEKEMVLTDLLRNVRLPASKSFEVPFDPWVGLFFRLEDTR